MNYKLSEKSHYVHLRRESWTHPGQFNSLFCPFQYSEVDQTYCGETCPHFEVEREHRGVKVSLHCVPGREPIAIKD